MFCYLVVTDGNLLAFCASHLNTGHVTHLSYHHCILSRVALVWANTPLSLSLFFKLFFVFLLWPHYFLHNTLRGTEKTDLHCHLQTEVLSPFLNSLPFASTTVSSSLSLLSTGFHSASREGCSFAPHIYQSSLSIFYFSQTRIILWCEEKITVGCFSRIMAEVKGGAWFLLCVEVLDLNKAKSWVAFKGEQLW